MLFDGGLTYNPSTNALATTTFTGALVGNSTTATALATGRTIGMTGDVAWTSASFTGAGNVTGTSTIGSDKIALAMMKANSVDSPQYVDCLLYTSPSPRD